MVPARGAVTATWERASSMARSYKIFATKVLAYEFVKAIGQKKRRFASAVSRWAAGCAEVGTFALLDVVKEAGPATPGAFAAKADATRESNLRAMSATLSDMACCDSARQPTLLSTLDARCPGVHFVNACRDL